MRLLRRRAQDNDVPLDMTPMIDCIFLLLIFFMLSTRFGGPDHWLVSRLSTQDGQGTPPDPPPLREKVRIAILPAAAMSGADLGAVANTVRAGCASFAATAAG